MSLFRTFNCMLNRIPALNYTIGHGNHVSQAIQKTWLHTSSVTLAARKGTREKARLKKIKKEVQKVSFIPHNQRKNRLVRYPHDRHLERSGLKPCPDDVYLMIYYKVITWPAIDGIKTFQELHHPTVFNRPDAYIYANVELNMQGEKKTRFVDGFTRTCLIPHTFQYGDPRSVIVFSKEAEIQKLATDAGAAIAGGPELIRSVQNGEIKLSAYDFVLAHPNILTDLVPIRGLLKRKFPSAASGTMDLDIPNLVKKFCGGIQFRANKDTHQENFAKIEIPIGVVQMQSEHLAENFQQLLIDIDKHRPKRAGFFVTRAYLTCPPAKFTIKVDPFEFIPSGVVADEPIKEAEENIENQEVDSDDEDDQKKEVKAKM